ncbi:MAG: hypothetical protein HYV00_10730 [Deltaproteobacteria bacterium]|nr:hypothetical protein [Deltaproteobacteria bacterium]
MITSILDVTTLEAQMVKLDKEEFGVSELLDELRLVYDLPLNKELTLIWDYPGELPVLKTDRGKLRHVLRNLINNAIKFTENGSVTISAWYYPARRTVEVRVADTGIGIPQTAISVIFDRFRQVDSSETSPSVFRRCADTLRCTTMTFQTSGHRQLIHSVGDLLYRSVRDQ